jgi:outer membrane lipoprotein-sorting protein
MKRLAILALLFLAGCGGTRGARPEKPIDDPQVVLNALRERSEAMQALSGQLALEVWQKGDRVRLRQLVLVQRPDKIRVDTLSPFDQPLSMMASDGQQVSIYSLEKKRFWRGPATPDNLARLVPLRLEGDELAAVLRGSVPVLRDAQAKMDWDAEAGCYRLELTGATRRQQLCVEPQGLRVLESRVWRGDALQYAAKFGQYTEGPQPIPQRMRFEVPGEDLKVDVRVVDFKANPTVAEDAFTVEPPRGIEVEPLD